MISLKEYTRKMSSTLSLVLVPVAIAFFVGLAIGGYHETHANTVVVGSELTLPPAGVDFSPLYKAWNILNERYVPATTSTTTVTDQDKIWGAIQGLAKSLGDPYTVFFPPVENKAFAEDINGSFGGVGMEVGLQDDIVTVIAPLKGTPADKAGIRAGDQILKINGASTEGIAVDEAVNEIRGDIGTKVHLTIGRAGNPNPIEVDITRAAIQVPIITGENRVQDGVYVIGLYSFGATATDGFRTEMKNFLASGDRRLIIDLRGNPGGYLEAAVDIASWFLPVGDVVVEERGGGVDNFYRSKGYDVYGGGKFEVAILIDQGSASASEILAGALSEHGVATLIGNRSFGKGSVQELINVTPDTSLKVTVARWYTPDGKSISLSGLTPSIFATTTAEDLANGRDPQMARAVQFLTTGK
jgi:carboxyl-terminal processing protease